jgi:hypothetical protein
VRKIFLSHALTSHFRLHSREVAADQEIGRMRRCFRAPAHVGAVRYVSVNRKSHQIRGPHPQRAGPSNSRRHPHLVRSCKSLTNKVKRALTAAHRQTTRGTANETFASAPAPTPRANGTRGADAAVYPSTPAHAQTGAASCSANRDARAARQVARWLPSAPDPNEPAQRTWLMECRYAAHEFLRRPQVQSEFLSRTMFIFVVDRMRSI